MSQHAGTSVHRGPHPGARNLPAGMPRRGRKLKERFRVSEHPFGTVKFYDGAHYFLCKGKEKVAAENRADVYFLRHPPRHLHSGRRAKPHEKDARNKTSAETSGDTYAILKETHR